MKKALILFLVLAMVLPMALIQPMAATVKPGSKLPTAYTLKIGGTSYKLVNYDIPIYTINTSEDYQDLEGNPFTRTIQNIVGATEDNWNAKLIWPSTDPNPTLYLKGFVFDEFNNETGLMAAKIDASTESGYKKHQTYSIVTDKSAPLDIVLVGEDSFIEAMFGITYYHDTTITSDGATKLTMSNEASCIAPNQSTGSLTINANLDLTLGRFYNTQYAAAVIHTYGGDLTINGGNLDLKCNPKETKVLVAMAAKNGADLTINGGVINCDSIIGAARNNGCIQAEGKLTINGGNITALPKDALGLHGRKGIEMNGGIVNTTAKLWAISFGKSKDEPAEFVFNGGTLTASSKRTFHEECTNITLGPNTLVYAGSSQEKAELFEGEVEDFYTKSWIRLTDDPSHDLDWDGADNAVPTTPTIKPNQTKPTTKPTTEPTTAPTTAPTQATTKATQAPTTAPTKVTQAPTTKATQTATRQPVASKPHVVVSIPVQTTPAATTKGTQATVATQATQVTEMTQATEATQATEITEATEEVVVTEATAMTEATQATEATAATAPADEKPQQTEKSKAIFLVPTSLIAAVILGIIGRVLVIRKKK